MPDPAAVDSSPLIVLARAGLFDLLRVAGDPVVVPTAVVLEVNRYGPQDGAVQAIRNTSWLTVVGPVSTPAALRHPGLGQGEAAVLAWVLAHPNSRAIIDDESARRRPTELGIPMRGTLGLVVDAKRRGIIEEARPLIERIRQAGLYAADDVVRTALRLAGE